MDLELMLYAVVMLVAGVMYIATTSIATECANESAFHNPNDKEKNYKLSHPSNFGFIIFNLVCAIFITISGLIGIYLAATQATQVVEE